jgi:2-methylcitrate dehydratase PrpD
MNFMTRRRLLRTAAIATGGLAASKVFGQTAPEPLALALARALNRTAYGALPPEAVKNAKTIIASTLASAAPGALIGSARIIRDLAKERAGRGEAMLWFDVTKLPLTEVARVNAMCSDAAASDDSDLRNVAHTGTCLTAVGLAIGEKMGATGQDLLTAMVAGYEAAGRIGDAISGDRSGFHASVIVAFGGTVAAAKLLKLTDEQMAHAISITATTMGGITIGTNSWAREYHAGNAALCAVNAAQAAGRGFTVNPDMLEARRGFLALFGGSKADKQRMTRAVGQDLDIDKYLAIKLVPGAHALQSSAEAAVNAAKQANAAPDEIARILISGPQTRGDDMNKTPPKDMIEAIHSLPYFVASGIADKDFSWVHASDEKIHRPVIAKLIGVIDADPAPPAVHYNWDWGGTVTIVTKSGGRFTSTVDAPKGSAPRGIEWGDVDAKYRALIPDSKLPKQRTEEILQKVHDFDQVKKVAEFVALLRGRLG